ncbi:MAG TPA: transposase [Pyrinomonadaceae bacterium]|nr:transposase [Pyrinomonadaceae bacterium]
MEEDNRGEKKNPAVVEYRHPGIALPVADALTEVLRSGARELLQQAIEAEVAGFIAQHRELKDEQNHQRIVRNGYQAERRIQTGIGEVPVKAPRVRDRQGTIKFSLSILPRYFRRTKSIEELLPWLYLKGLSTGDSSTALTALLGQDAPALSAATISRLKEVWKEEQQRWSSRDLTSRNFVYLWVDGVHFGVRLEDASQRILVVIGPLRTVRSNCWRLLMATASRNNRGRSCCWI